MSGAFALAVTSVGLLAGMDALVKAQAAQFPVAADRLLALRLRLARHPHRHRARAPARPRLETVIANSWRAVLGVSTSITFYFALGRLPLAETLALSLLSPCVTVLFGMLILRESVSRPLVIALGIGFLGMLRDRRAELRPGRASIAALEGTLAVLISTVTYSLSLVLLRSRATRDHPLIIVAVQNVGPMLILSALIPLLGPAGLWVPTGASDLLNFAGIGTLGVCGHLVLAKAYSRRPLGAWHPPINGARLWRDIRLLFFGEIPAWTTIAGGLLIVVSSFSATRR